MKDNIFKSKLLLLTARHLALREKAYTIPLWQFRRWWQTRQQLKQLYRDVLRYEEENRLER